MGNFLEDLYAVSDYYSNRFGISASPFEIVTRLTEEVGEVANAVNRAEGMGRKKEKQPSARPEHIAAEAVDVLHNLLALIRHYGLEDELEQAVTVKVLRARAARSAAGE